MKPTLVSERVHLCEIVVIPGIDCLPGLGNFG
jgi:hypothetical protein